jgi:hypothetical protein
MGSTRGFGWRGTCRGVGGTIPAPAFPLGETTCDPNTRVELCRSAAPQADQPLHKRMGERNMGDGFDLGHLQYPQIGLPLNKPEKWIMVGAEVLGHPRLPSNGTIEHPTECDTVDGSGMDAESNDSAGILIHHDQDPVGPQGGRFAPEQNQTQESVFDVANEGQPRRPTRVVSWPIIAGENPANNVSAAQCEDSAKWDCAASSLA